MCSVWNFLYWTFNLMTRTSTLLQDHTEYNATRMDVRNSIDWGGQIGTAPLTWSRPAFLQQLKCSISNTLIGCIRMRWVGSALSPTSYILSLSRKLIFIYMIVISGKMYLKSKLQQCLYVSREWAHAPNQQAAPLPDQWCMKLRPGSCNRHIHLMCMEIIYNHIEFVACLGLEVGHSRYLSISVNNHKKH